MVFNPSQAENIAGLDQISANTRVRATVNPVTFAGVTVAAVNTSYTVLSNPVGTNYIDGANGAWSATVTGLNPPYNWIPTNGQTLPAAYMLNGVTVVRPGAGVTLNTDTAANMLIAANAVSAGAQVGDFITCLIMNDSANSMTLAMGAGVTSANASTTAIAANTSRYCLFQFTNVTAGSAAVTMFF